MIPLGNAKIGGLIPAWAPFPGISILFDNPGASLDRTSWGIRRVRCNVETETVLEMYKTLKDAFNSVVGAERASLEHDLFILPEYSFHVTVADLVNVANVHQLKPLARYEAETLFKHLPISLRQGLPPLLDAKAIRDIVESEWRARFQFKDLAIRDDLSLVARLKSDKETALELDRICELRTAVDDELAQIGKPRNDKLTPHVTLAYFLGPRAAQEAREKHLARWNREFSSTVDDAMIEFSRASVYGFTNMVEFFKADVEDPPALKVSIGAICRDVQLREKGYRKLAVTQIYKDEEPARAVDWNAIQVSGRCPVWATSNAEVAYFTETARQDRHFHSRATEIFTVLWGKMLIDVNGESHELYQGESIIVAPGAIHEVHPSGERFVAMVVAVNSDGSSDKLTVGAEVPRPNVTLAAFYGKPKPPGLVSLVDAVNADIRDTISKRGGVYAEYASDKLHLTVLGLEGLVLDSTLFNANYWSNNGSRIDMDVAGLVALLKAFAKEYSPLFRIRFCGFAFGECECKDAALFSWGCDSGGFHTFNRSAYQGSFYIAAPKNCGAFSPVVITGWPVGVNHTRFPRTLYGLRYAAGGLGFLDKYHRRDKPYWRDDDCWATLGKIKADDSTRAEIIAGVRGALSKRKPLFVDIALDDLSVVTYEDTELKHATTVPVAEVLKSPKILGSIYGEISAKIARNGAQ